MTYVFLFNPLYTENPWNGYLDNSEDPDEMQLCVVQFSRQKRSSD